MSPICILFPIVATATLEPVRLTAGRCETVAIVDDLDELTIECLNGCGVYGCTLYPTNVPGYGIGYSCGCPVGGPSICCHLVAGYDQYGNSFSIQTGNCNSPTYSDCDPGNCKKITEFDGDVLTVSAACDDK